jgi:RNA polymerase sigma-70 factor (ECF subfamily)
MGLALKMLGDYSAAEDVVQETFWRVWRRAETFDIGRGAVLGWLFGITRNLCIDRLRQGRSDPSLDTIESRIPAADQPGPDEPVWTALQHSQVRDAVLTLPADQRTVIELAYFRGLTRQQIAQSEGVPLGTIHSRARLALRKLRESLQDSGYLD